MDIDRIRKKVDLFVESQHETVTPKQETLFDFLFGFFSTIYGELELFHAIFEMASKLSAVGSFNFPYMERVNGGFSVNVSDGKEDSGFHLKLVAERKTLTLVCGCKREGDICRLKLPKNAFSLNALLSIYDPDNHLNQEKANKIFRYALSLWREDKVKKIVRFFQGVSKKEGHHYVEWNAFKESSAEYIERTVRRTFVTPPKGRFKTKTYDLNCDELIRCFLKRVAAATAACCALETMKANALCDENIKALDLLSTNLLNCSEAILHYIDITLDFRNEKGNQSRSL